MKVNEAIFRDYDIRGLVGEDIDEEFSRVFGQAFGSYLLRKGTREVIVGYDARSSSPSYYQKAIEGLTSTGIDVIRVGMITSPMMYWARKFWRIDGGLVVTASHNPPQFNGFKPASGGGAMFGEGIQKLKRLMIAEDFERGEGKISDREIFDEYTSDIASKVQIKRPLAVIVDCGNSTPGPFAPVVLEKLGVRVERLFCDIDPAFPNHPPDPVDPRAYPVIQKKIKASRFDLGLLFDGDADRLGVIDHQGNIVRGDEITALCARKILKTKPGAKVLFEIQCSQSATDDVVAHGGRVKLIRVGHSYIEEALAREKAELAGETSGHVFFGDRWYGFDDAIYAAARLLEYVSEGTKSLSEHILSLPKYVATPQTRIAAPEGRKFAIVEELKKYFQKSDLYSSSEESSSRRVEKSSGSSSRQARTISRFKLLTIDGVRLEWEDGWAVVRASNTQPQLTLRAEAKTEERLGEIKKIIEEALALYGKEGVNLVWGQVASNSS